MDEEIGDAEKYAALAMKYKDADPDLARVYYALSLEEMEHMAKLHAAAENIIKKYRDEKGEPPADMMRVYQILHEKQIRRAANVKAMQAMFRDN
jgi:hypothetical protein